MSDALSGRTGRRQLELAREAQASQRAEIAKREADLDAVETGQRNLLTGGGGGMLAFIDKRKKQAEEALKTTFGGGSGVTA